MEIFNSEKERKIIIRETNSFRGIPYADYFNVNTEWMVKSDLDQKDVNTGRPFCHVTIHLSFTFHKSTWLQGTIESNTKAELVGVFELWKEAADATIKEKAASTAKAATKAEDNKENLSVNIADSDNMLDMEDVSMHSTGGEQQLC